MMSPVMSFSKALVWDIRIQARYYFWIAAVIISVMWWGLFHLLSISFSVFMPVIIYADVLNLGFLFIGGIIYLERRQGTIYATAVTPFSPAVWFCLKLVSLTMLCTVCASAIIALTGDSPNWLRIIPAVILSSMLFIMIGLLVVIPFDSVMNYFLCMALLMVLLNLPIFEYVDLFSHIGFYLLPSYAALLSISGSINEVPLAEYLMSLGLLCCWVFVFYFLSRKAIINFVATRQQQ